MSSDELKQHFADREQAMRALAKKSRSSLGRQHLLDVADGYAYSAAIAGKTDGKATEKH